MKALVFDTGPIISLTQNNLLWLLEPLKQRFSGEFCITPAVYDELIRRPLETKKYKFEALQVLPLVTGKILTMVEEPEIGKLAADLRQLANSCFRAGGSEIKIVHQGEAEVMACAISRHADTVVIDERTSRVLIERPKLLREHLERKLHTGLQVNEDNLARLSQKLAGISVIRSFELAAVAFELGLLDRYALKEEERLVPDIRRAVLEGVLWGVKLNGCSVKTEEIEQVLRH